MLTLCLLPLKSASFGRAHPPDLQGSHTGVLCSSLPPASQVCLLWTRASSRSTRLSYRCVVLKSASCLSSLPPLDARILQIYKALAPQVCCAQVCLLPLKSLPPLDARILQIYKALIQVCCAQVCLLPLKFCLLWTRASSRSTRLSYRCVVLKSASCLSSSASFGRAHPPDLQGSHTGVLCSSLPPAISSAPLPLLDARILQIYKALSQVCCAQVCLLPLNSQASAIGRAHPPAPLHWLSYRCGCDSQLCQCHWTRAPPAPLLAHTGVVASQLYKPAIGRAHPPESASTLALIQVWLRLSTLLIGRALLQLLYIGSLHRCVVLKSASCLSSSASFGRAHPPDLQGSHTGVLIVCLLQLSSLCHWTRASSRSTIGSHTGVLCSSLPPASQVLPPLDARILQIYKALIQVCCAQVCLLPLSSSLPLFGRAHPPDLQGSHTGVFVLKSASCRNQCYYFSSVCLSLDARILQIYKALIQVCCAQVCLLPHSQALCLSLDARILQIYKALIQVCCAQVCLLPLKFCLLWTRASSRSTRLSYRCVVLKSASCLSSSASFGRAHPPDLQGSHTGVLCSSLPPASQVLPPLDARILQIYKALIQVCCAQVCLLPLSSSSASFGRAHPPECHDARKLLYSHTGVDRSLTVWEPLLASCTCRIDPKLLPQAQHHRETDAPPRNSLPVPGSCPESPHKCCITIDAPHSLATRDCSPTLIVSRHPVTAANDRLEKENMAAKPADRAEPIIVVFMLETNKNIVPELDSLNENVEEPRDIVGPI